MKSESKESVAEIVAFYSHFMIVAVYYRYFCLSRDGTVQV